MSKVKRGLLIALLWLLHGLGLIIAVIVAVLIFIHELILQGEEPLEKKLKQNKKL